MRQARVNTRKAVQNRQTYPARSRHESRIQIIGYRNSFRYCAGSGLVSWMQRHEVHGNADKLAEHWWKRTGICTTGLMREKCMGTGEGMGGEDQVGPEWKGLLQDRWGKVGKCEGIWWMEGEWPWRKESTLEWMRRGGETEKRWVMKSMTFLPQGVSWSKQ